MTIIEKNSLQNGAHRNQTVSGVPTHIPDGWAILPESIGAPDSLDAFPFGEILTSNIDGVEVVTKWVPGVIQEPESFDPQSENIGQPVTDSEMVAAILEGVDAV